MGLERVQKGSRDLWTAPYFMLMQIKIKFQKNRKLYRFYKLLNVCIHLVYGGEAEGDDGYADDHHDEHLLPPIHRVHPENHDTVAS